MHETEALILAGIAIWLGIGMVFCAMEGTCHHTHIRGKLLQLVVYLLIGPIVVFRLILDR